MTILAGSDTTAFSLSASDAIWEELLCSRPTAGVHSVVHLVRRGLIKLTGSHIDYERNVQIVRSLIDEARGHTHVDGPGHELHARGEYHRITTSLGTSDVYVERVGNGEPLLAFSTAGSNTAQWHGLMTHTDVAGQYELITVDMPWHGRSSPSWASAVGSYSLTPDTFTEFIVAVCSSLALDRPVLVGVSMAGAAVIHAIATHPQRSQAPFLARLAPQCTLARTSISAAPP